MKTITQITAVLCLLLGQVVNAQTNIQLMPVGSQVNHNATNCSVEINAQAFAIIHNAPMNAEVKFIDFGGQIMHSEINVSGQQTWQPSFMLNGFNVVSDYYAVNNNMVNTIAMTNVMKIICNGDTLMNPTIFINEPANFTPCNYNAVKGKIYVDYNSDCNFNQSDVGITYITPQIAANYTNTPFQNNFTMPNNNGNYEVHLQENYLQNYTVSIPSIYAFTFPNSPCMQVSQTFTSLPQNNVDFALQCADIDTYVTLTSTPARPNVPFGLTPRVFNIGCDQVSGVLKLKLDPNVTYNAAQSSHPADAQVGDTLYWNYLNLNNLANNTAYFNQFLGGISVTPSLSVNIGDTLWFELSTAVNANDVNPANNSLLLAVPIVNSFDPNLKEASPKGRGPEGYIPVETDAITYTVRFQNTGSAEALNIYVIDTLEANLEPKSLQILANSHYMSPEWLSESVLKFNFPNIHLADSASNEPMSHGFVTFKLNLKPNLPVGTVIKNKVGIYFDYNEPVITNYAVNTLENTMSTNKIEQSTTVLLYPNPAKNTVTISFSDKTDGTLELIDLTGKTVLEEQLAQVTSKQITINDLQKGMYIYQLRDAKNKLIQSGKLIVE